MRDSRAHALHQPSFEAGRIGFAIGDVHGRADLLEPLLIELAKVALEQAQKPVAIFIGDYIDRGPDSARVLDLLTSPLIDAFECRFLLGNHEQMLLSFLDNPSRGRRWLCHGGLNTLGSYGVHAPAANAGAEAFEETAEALRMRMPRRHDDFLRGLERYVEAGDYLFVHAGIDPSKPLEAQTDTDLLWIRDRFLKSRKKLRHCIVHGHTPVPAPLHNAFRIAVDTGAYATGVLTAARLDGPNVSFVTARSAGFSRA